MNPHHEDAARALSDERQASSARWHQVIKMRDAHREARRAERPVTSRRWWGRFGRQPVSDTSPVAPTPPEGSRLESILDQTAEHIVESGTRTESAALRAMSAATHRLSPAAAAALVDWGGPEIARLRAFGIVHGVVLRELDIRGRHRLLKQLTESADCEGPVSTARRLRHSA